MWSNFFHIPCLISSRGGISVSAAVYFQMGPSGPIVISRAGIEPGAPPSRYNLLFTRLWVDFSEQKGHSSPNFLFMLHWFFILFPQEATSSPCLVQHAFKLKETSTINPAFYGACRSAGGSSPQGWCSPTTSRSRTRNHRLLLCDQQSSFHATWNKDRKLLKTSEGPLHTSFMSGTTLQGTAVLKAERAPKMGLMIPNGPTKGTHLRFPKLWIPRIPVQF